MPEEKKPKEPLECKQCGDAFRPYVNPEGREERELCRVCWGDL